MSFGLTFRRHLTSLSRKVDLFTSCQCSFPMFSQFAQGTANQNVRWLYSDEHLGLPRFRRQRAAVANRFGSTLKEQYIERLRASIDQGDPVFTDDIKTVISLAETKDDVDLMVELLRRYLAQNNELVPDFRFGPLVMRVLTITGQCDLALEMHRDPELKSLFEQFTSAWLLLDMLYEESRCLEALCVYDTFAQLNKNRTIPAASTTLALACCYKMASEESFERCLDILREAQRRKSLIGSRGVCFAAMLALKMHRPAVCLEILALRPRSLRPTPINNLRAMALADLGRLEDALHILRFVLHQDSPHWAGLYGRSRPTIFPDTVDRINAAAFKRSDPTLTERMRNVENALRDGGHVITGQRFDDFLNMTVKLPRRSFSRNRPKKWTGSRRLSTGPAPRPKDAEDVKLADEKLAGSVISPSLVNR